MSLGVVPALDATTSVIEGNLFSYTFVGQDRTPGPRNADYIVTDGTNVISGYTVSVYNGTYTDVSFDLPTIQSQIDTTFIIKGLNVYSPQYAYEKGLVVSYDIPSFQGTAGSSRAAYSVIMAFGGYYGPFVEQNLDGFFVRTLYTFTFTSAQGAYTLTSQPKVTDQPISRIYWVSGNYGVNNLLNTYRFSPPETFADSGVYGCKPSAYLQIGQIVTITGASMPIFNRSYTVTALNDETYTFDAIPVYTTGGNGLPVPSTWIADSTELGDLGIRMNTTCATVTTTGTAPASLEFRLTVGLQDTFAAPRVVRTTEPPYITPRIANILALDAASPFFLPYQTGDGTSTMVIEGTAPAASGPYFLKVNAYDPSTIEYLGSIQTLLTFTKGYITVTPPFGTRLNIYRYEPFSYRISFVTSGGTSTANSFAGTSVNLLPYLTKDSTGVTFAAPSGYSGIATPNGEDLVITDSLGNKVSTVVYVGAGRFYPPASGASYTFYRNEAITPIVFDTCANIIGTYTQPSLPVGLTFTPSNGSLNRFRLQGTSPTTVSRSNYLFVGSNASNQIVTSIISFQVLPERLGLTALPSSTVLSVGTPVPFGSIAVTASIPTSAQGSLRYTWSALPSGLEFQDASGNAVGYPFYPTGTSMYLTGTPTSVTSVSLANAGCNSTSVSINANAYGANGALANTATLNFTYGPTVMFYANGIVSSLMNPTLVRGVPAPVYAFTANVYYSDSTPISRIFSPDLRSDLSLNYNPTTRSATITGTPTSVGTGTYTMRAIRDSDGLYGDLQLTIPVSEDTITISGPRDICMNYIAGRDVTFPYAGYYSGATVTASALSGLPVTVTSSTLPDGISFSGGSLVGIPLHTSPLSTVTFTATDGIATATKSVQIAVVGDIFTWAAITPPTFKEGAVITPFKVSATTVSGRSIASYSASGFPGGISVSIFGVVYGACGRGTSGVATITANTGFSTGTISVPYTFNPDVISLTSSQTTYQLPNSPTTGSAITPIQISATTGSHKPIINYTLTSNQYGITISSTGLISGNFISLSPYQGVPIPSTVTLALRAYTQYSYAEVPAVIQTPNAYTIYRLLGIDNNLYSISPVSMTPTLVGTYSNTYSGRGTRTIAYGANNVIFVGGEFINSVFYYFRSTDGVNFEEKSFVMTNRNREPITGGNYPFSVSAVYVPYNLVPNAGNGTPQSGWRIVIKIQQETWYLTSVDNLVSIRQWFYQYTNPSDPTNLLLHSGIYYQYDDSGVYNYGDVSVIFVGGNTLIGNSKKGSRLDWGGFTTRYNGIRFVVNGGIEDPERCTLSYAVAFCIGPVWIAVGSSRYYLDETYTSDAHTIYISYSSTRFWDPVESGEFNFMGLDVIYINQFYAIGIDNVSSGLYQFRLRYSTNGTNWSLASMPSQFNPTFTFRRNGALGRLSTDGTNLNIVYTSDGVNRFILSHPLTTSFSDPTQWTTVPLSLSAPNTDFRLGERFTSPAWTTPASVTSTLVLGTNGSVISTPVFLTPTATTYRCMQFVTIDPIQVTTDVYSEYAVSELPRGLVFTDGVLRGTPVLVETTTVTITATNATGQSSNLELSFSVYAPNPEIRPQISASAFTSLVGQEAVINGAQSAQNNVALPSLVTTVGELMAPTPPSVVLTDSCPC